MIVSHLTGGAGNQLHMFAAGISAAGIFDTSLILDCKFKNFGSNTRRKFELTPLIPEIQFKNEIIINRELCLNFEFKNSKKQTNFSFLNHWQDTAQSADIQLRSIKDNTYMKGHFLDFSWINMAVSFGFPSSLDRLLDYSILKSKFEPGNINIHIRLGDYVNNRETFHQIPEIYYIESLNQVFETGKNIYLFTDSENLSKKIYPNIYNMSTIVKIKRNSNSLKILALMASGSSIIGSNSTFSSWASWFSQAEKIFTPIPHHKKNWHDTLPRSWIRYKLSS